MQDHDSISYPQLTAAAEAQIRDYVAFAAAAGDAAERREHRASAVSLFAFWQGFANRLHPTTDDVGRRALDADQRRLLALLG
ncbi:hypothetical protein [Burkholderia sp. Ac-20353]|uniref:hypothetical protein n=1 Tax=Burkholderia sp. Ac-20353 TaxID=2703894 RepID=UPI00197C1CDB|nr:hypothetical protein [Burkholderia sp. Ac-20353]MBN3786126.1 hypothetical protein [Burkholderia sp. Ac-20353]